jgi:antitoxin ParD1/3/4
MATLTIALSRAQQAFVRAQVKARGLRSAREYLEQLLLMDQLKLQPEKVDALLREGLRSGPATPMTPEDWEDVEREGLARLAEDKKHAGSRPNKPRRAE